MVQHHQSDTTDATTTEAVGDHFSSEGAVLGGWHTSLGARSMARVTAWNGNTRRPDCPPHRLTAT